MRKMEIAENFFRETKEVDDPVKCVGHILKRDFMPLDKDSQRISLPSCPG